MRISRLSLFLYENNCTAFRRALDIYTERFFTILILLQTDTV